MYEAMQQRFLAVVTRLADITEQAMVLARARTLSRAWSEDVRVFASGARSTEDVDAAIMKADLISRARASRFTVAGYWADQGIDTSVPPTTP